MPLSIEPSPLPLIPSTLEPRLHCTVPPRVVQDELSSVRAALEARDVAVQRAEAKVSEQVRQAGQ